MFWNLGKIHLLTGVFNWRSVGHEAHLVLYKLMFCEHDKKEDIWSQVIPESELPPREVLYILSHGPVFDSMIQVLQEP